MTPKPDSICQNYIFEKVFKDYSKMIRNFIYSKCGNLDLAEDLTQDAFVKLWNNCSKVSLETVKGYLFTLAKNSFLNEVKHQKVVLKYQNTKNSAQNNEDPEFVLRKKEFQNELNRAINNLSEKQREVFLLNRIDKKKYSEIAELLGLSVKAVEKRMHAALVSLRKDVKNYKI
ncbi:RNA polymerase sigma-70 factor [Seonamhaeicola sp.]|uniref:RNA polymerase sigma factor n=1 Tax=Seonamhaeicola sp. TaxID=1912245 RepID=UPI002622BD8C|nr:RNA polymerase sigma-70 factor [Seonamhaeicola sp.]